MSAAQQVRDRLSPYQTQLAVPTRATERVSVTNDRNGRWSTLADRFDHLLDSPLRLISEFGATNPEVELETLRQRGLCGQRCRKITCDAQVTDLERPCPETPAADHCALLLAIEPRLPPGIINDHSPGGAIGALQQHHIVTRCTPAHQQSET